MLRRLARLLIPTASVVMAVEAVTEAASNAVVREVDAVVDAVEASQGDLLLAIPLVKRRRRNLLTLLLLRR